VFAIVIIQNKVPVVKHQVVHGVTLPSRATTALLAARTVRPWHIKFGDFEMDIRKQAACLASLCPAARNKLCYTSPRNKNGDSVPLVQRRGCYALHQYGRAYSSPTRRQGKHSALSALAHCGPFVPAGIIAKSC